MNDDEAASIVNFITENMAKKNKEQMQLLIKKKEINELKQEVIKLNHKMSNVQFDLLLRIAMVLFALLMFMIVNLYTR